MVLATVTGRLSDFAGDPGLDVHPRVVFRPNGAAVGSDALFYGRPIVVDEFDSEGRFTVELESTDAIWHTTGGDVWYDVTVDRLTGGADYMPWDYPGWKLKVPATGGVFSALVTAPTNPAQMWVGPAVTAPQGQAGWDKPVQSLQPSAYTAWYKTNALPGELNYFEWE